MANYPQKTNVSVAVQGHSSDPLSHVTIASQDFGLFMPISTQYLIPGDEFHIKVDEVTRLLPMVNPAYVKCDSIVSAFAVPINYIFPLFNDFIDGELSASYTAGSAVNTTFRCNTVPHTKMYNFRSAFKTARLAVLSTSQDPVDFTMIDGDTRNNYHFTWKGKRFLKVLQGLGYNFSFDDALQSPDPNEAYLSVYDYDVSLLPLLAHCKFYLDWIVPARYITQYATLRAQLNYSVGSNAALAWSSSDLANIFIDFASFLDNDYFTAAWKYPASPENGMESFQVPALSDENGTILDIYHDKQLGSYYDPASIGGFVNSLSLQSVGALQSMLNRGMITGNKIKDFLRTEFGIEPSKDALRTSSYLGMSRNTFRIGEVFSSADTSAAGGQPLGAYAGRGNGAGSATFSYKADQHSILIITSQIIPHSVYFQGLRPLNTMLNRYDFFQPEFDNVGVRAIARKELFNATDFATQNFDPTDEDAHYMDGIFGFSPQYANLKVGYDNVIGDFRLKRYESDLSSWFAARKFKNPQQNGYYNNINANFCKVDGIENALGYDDLFVYQGTDIDHFYSLFDVQIQTSRPMVPLSDALILPEERGKRKVGVNTNNNPNV